MGYAHGMRWDGELVKEKVFEAMNYYKIDRMPSKKELDEYFGNSGLSNRISKTGGFYKLANALDLDVKKTETQEGLEYELLAIDKLEKMGHRCIHTGGKRFPYDILVDDCVKIDVKMSNPICSRDNGFKYFTANLEKKRQTCDLYIFYCVENEAVSKIYVIPSFILSGNSQLSIGYKESKYDIYLDRWDYVKRLDSAFKSLIQ